MVGAMQIWSDNFKPNYMISLSSQKEAVNTLHDLSDYATYLEERMSRLDRLYQTIDKTQKQQTRILPHANRTHKNKFNLTVKSLTAAEKNKSPLSLPNMYSTEYRREKGRYAKKSNAFRNTHKPDLQTDYSSLQCVRTSRDASLEQNYRISRPINHKERMELYTSTKKNMLTTFYVGGGNCHQEESHHKKGTLCLYSPPLEPIAKQKRGRLWHGRPPVKIITDLN